MPTYLEEPKVVPAPMRRQVTGEGRGRFTSAATSTLAKARTRTGSARGLASTSRGTTSSTTPGTRRRRFRATPKTIASVGRVNVCDCVVCPTRNAASTQAADMPPCGE
jgi:hypothetical protein